MTDDPAANPSSSRRRWLFALFAIVVVLGTLAAGLWWVKIGSRRITTDNAYVDADVAHIAAQTAGSILEIHGDETQAVHAGDVLVVIDPADARLAVAEAETALELALRRVRQYGAERSAAIADIGVAQTRLAQAQTDLERRRKLVDSGAISAEAITTARSAYDAAAHSLVAAREQEAKHAAMIDGATARTHPEVRAAQIALETAQLALARTTIRSPIDGIIAERRVALGQRVQVGAALVNVVPIDRAYVNANFKENQLRRVRIGQAALLTSDLYGDAVTYHGTVVGVGGGTGAAFSIIPAQNASGNWIKIVQRVPVRIRLDANELREHPLRVGLSMSVEIILQGPLTLGVN